MRTRSRWTSTVCVVAAVAAGLRDFSAELEPIADGVLGPSQWEPGIGFQTLSVRLQIGFWTIFKGSLAKCPTTSRAEVLQPD